MLELRLHGRGGQGVVTLAELLARTALRAGNYAQTMPQFGVERRGAAVKTSVRLSDSPIKLRSQSLDPDILVLMHKNLLSASQLDGVHARATYVVGNAEPLDLPHDQWYLDAVAVAVENKLIVGGEPYTNVPMLGALCRILELPAQLMIQEIELQWPGKRAVPNIAAAKAAYETVQLQKGGAGK